MQNISFLNTDLYQLSMSGAYFQEGIHETPAVFEGFVRKLPEHRNFLVSAGLGALTEVLHTWKLDGYELFYLKTLPQFKNLSEQFWNYLYSMRFTGQVFAPKEGTLLFENEPFIRVEGPLIQCQLIETLLLSILNYSTAVASKAARIRIASNAKTLSEFGFRRAPGPGAASLASRAAYIGGFNSTSNCMAGFNYNIPVAGTMAHSYVLAHETEKAAFDSYVSTYEEGVALVDTFNPLTGALNALESFKTGLLGVRLDSGDKIEISRRLREVLDKGGAPEATIVVSDDLNEQKIKLLEMFDAPIDGYGVGTELVNPGPLGGVYKLVSLNGQNKAKLSQGKATYPGAKQIFRHYDEKGKFSYDVLGLANEQLDGEPLLQPVMNRYFSLYKAREKVQDELSKLPKKFLSLDEKFTYDVKISPELRKEIENVSR